MIEDELHFMTITQVSELLRTRQLSPVEYTTALIERSDAINPLIDAFVLRTVDFALAQASKAQAEIMAGNWRGPMHGVPFALKDIYDTAGIRTTAHSRQLLNNVPTTDAVTVRKLHDAGAVLMGKLATHEFAHGGPTFDLAFPPARNPWDLEYVPGGSSSGAGAAVAAGLVPAALGSDTGGSIRGPAGLCGIVGLKPTYGLVSKQGVIANSFTFDHAGPMTWTAQDCAIVLQAIAGHEPSDPSSVNVPIPDYRSTLREDLRGVRIGHVAHFYEQDTPCSAEQRAAMQAAIGVLRDLGATVEEVQLQPLETYYDVKIIIAEAELLSVHWDGFVARPYDFSSDLRRRILPACVFTALDYVNALRMRQRLIDEAKPVFAQYDALLTLGNGPSSKLADHRTVSSWESPKITTAFNVIGGGAVSLCNGFSDKGLPLSMQIASRPFEDATALAIAHAYEGATNWRARRPGLAANTIKPDIVPLYCEPERPELDAQSIAIAQVAAQRSGLELDETLFIELCEGLPHALAMARRLNPSFARNQEPCLSFRMPV
ncbi:MAG: aspartyl-tRNA(Asn)/glutamyl-tRNA(Gln) amidotransferase subunit A [Gammaproteobacteria bacterium]|jgi:aspartyl-tRNA(Asn)/glutamyl-tRNA(Gln) amidotransferase subunit A